jgi:hypothetical protein
VKWHETEEWRDARRAIQARQPNGPWWPDWESIAAVAVAADRRLLAQKVEALTTFEVDGVPMRDVGLYRMDVLALLEDDG